MEELKACPFCGGKAEHSHRIHITPVYDDNGAYVDITECVYYERTGCSACDIWFELWDDGPEGITIEKWNRQRNMEWIKFEKRALDEEEQNEHPEWFWMFDCPIPDDGQEILVSNGHYVWTDVFNYDEEYGCYLDGDSGFDGIWWMPLPEPPKEET